jgi:gliding motility-associated-like protein
VTTTYTVTVSQNGCTSTATVTITVDTDHDIFIPDAFSPNGDGFNETWLVHGKGIKFIHITVYDRIGEKMFEANDISVGWDGTYKGSPMNTAVFVYYVEVGYFDDTTQSFKGDLSLVR